MYSDLDNAFNNNTEDIDKMAREIHMKKTNLFNTVYNDYNNQKFKWDQDIKEYNSGKIHPNNLKMNLDDTIDSISIDSPDLDLDSISIDSPELDSIIDSVSMISKKDNYNSISKYINNTDKCKKIKKGEDIFLHIKNCYDCRNKLIKHLKNNNKLNKEKNGVNMKINKSTIEQIKDEYSEIFIIIIIGIIVIFILDFLMKSLVIQNSIR